MSEERTCRRYLPEKAGLHAQVHQHCIIAVEDHLVDVVELTVSEVLIDKRAVLLITQGHSVLLDVHRNALLEMRALEG